MDNNEIKDLYFEYFGYIFDLGYNEVKIFENEYGANITIIQSNLSIKQRISFCFYKKGSIRPDLLTNDAIYISLFNINNEHIDFSRLLSQNNLIKNRCIYQYIELSNENTLKDTLYKISKVIKEKYMTILYGDDWINISYNIKDDY